MSDTRKPYLFPRPCDDMTHPDDLIKYNGPSKSVERARLDRKNKQARLKRERIAFEKRMGFFDPIDLTIAQTNADALALMAHKHARYIMFNMRTGNRKQVREQLKVELRAAIKGYKPRWSIEIHQHSCWWIFHLLLHQFTTRYRAVRFSVTGNVATLDASEGLRFTGTLDYTEKQLDTITQDLNKWLAEVVA